jgi:beta-xylosidase
MDPQDRRKYNLLQETVLVRVVTSKSRGGLDRFRTSRVAHKSFWESKQAEGRNSDKIWAPRIKYSKALLYQSVM